MINTYLVEGKTSSIFIKVNSWQELYDKVFSKFENLKDDCEFGWQVLQEKGFVKIDKVEISKIVGYVVKRFVKNKSQYIKDLEWCENDYDLLNNYQLAKEILERLDDNNAFILPITTITLRALDYQLKGKRK